MPAHTGNNYAKGNSGGRQTLYKDEYNEQAYKYCILGATDKQLADFFNVSKKTLYKWKKEHEEFLHSVTRGKTIADAEVAASFHKRAKGYERPTEKLFQYQGTIIRANSITHYPADPGAALNWLKNRQPKKWRDKPEVQQTTKHYFIDHLDG